MPTAASALFARSGAGVLGVSYLLVDGGVQENRDLDYETPRRRIRFPLATYAVEGGEPLTISLSVGF